MKEEKEGEKGFDFVGKMEGEGQAGGNGGGAAVVAASGGGGGGGSEADKKKTLEAEPKVKRKMKTTAQLEVLEKTYAVEPYPSEAMRAELSIKLGLSDRQLQMWFCHRRLKDRKAKMRQDESPAALAGAGDELMLGSSSGGEIGNELSLGKNPLGRVEMLQPRVFHHQPGAAVPRIGFGGEIPAVKRYYEPPQAISELRAIAFVEAQLGGPIREDGPILGMEFDPLPPGAFGAPIVTARQQKSAGRPYEVQIYERLETSPNKDAKRSIHEYQFLPEQPSIRSDTHERALSSHYNGQPSDVHSSRIPLPSGQSVLHGHYQVSSGYSLPTPMTSLSLLPQQGKQGQHLSPAMGDVEIVPRKTSFVSIGVDASYSSHPITGLEKPYMPSERRVIYDEERLEKKRKSEEARIAREVEAHEKRIRKELEKQDLLRRKREEQIRKEMERQDRERRKEEERLLREKQREEERYQREQRREMERRERFLQKESIRAEKMRLKEELRKEREAARLKAANDRATARRIAKESIELIEDEHLELMELAASNKGLPSFLALDSESLENLESFRDMLPEFPMKSVQVKRPFAIQPWIDSEDNVGDLLMVWRFLITFADVLGLWPFTLDEFLQAFHDYDARLLGEVHIALLRTVIKDIEDVARTPATALGANQSSAVSAGGGHPHIVEGAFAWGFDIRSWQSHLNPLTWPEILRQFALSAGFGPKLKKRGIGQALRDENEGDDGADIISNLRNGVAAENALAIMQERGLSNPRRSRHRLTPGTVKFAAFHVLSLEGSKGLTILEVAEKIQKSGLRDLSTSKTPEASISAALSRDTKLFERTAPSTYCVRAPYRKDPAEAETILAAAREKVQFYKSGQLDGEEAEDVEKENAERDEDSDSEEAEDPEAEDLDTQLKPDKETIHSRGGSRLEGNNCFEDGKMNSWGELMETPEGRHGARNSSSLGQPKGENEAKDTGTSGDRCNDFVEKTISNQEDTVIDENDTGEPWVQGLTEGEYSDLSVQERLDALVALINVANEGNSIRVILEERLEAANALKKQMWAEAQLDKRRLKEDYPMKVQYSTYIANRADQTLPGTTAEGRQSPLLAVDNRNELASTNPVIQQGELGSSQIDPNVLSDIYAERRLLVQDLSAGPDNPLLQQSAYAFEMSRSQLKSYIAYRAEEMYVYRSLPLGQDRRRNRYWQFITSPSQNDPGSGRIFVELRDGRWRLIDSIEDFDALLASLDVRGFRESHLHSMLQKIEVPFKETVKRNLSSNSSDNVGDTCKKEISEVAPHPDFSINSDSPRSSVCVSNSDMAEPSSSFVIGLGRNKREKCKALTRYQDYESWMWEECFNPTILSALRFGRRRCKLLLSTCNCCHDSYFSEDNHCPSCHGNYNSSVKSSKVSEHVTQCKEKSEKESTWNRHISESPPPLKIKLLKALLTSMEASIPPEAFEPMWSEEARKFWGMKLQTASSSEDLLQILTLLESVMRQDFLSPDYETTNDLLGLHNLSGSVSNNPSLGVVAVLPWIPDTASAVALRLMELDISICYTLQQKEEREKNKVSGNFPAPPSKNPFAENVTQDMLGEHLNEGENMRQDCLDDLGIGRGRGRGRPRAREGKSQRRVTDPKSEAGRRSTTTNGDKLGALPAWKAQSRARGGRRRARRSARNRQKTGKQVAERSGNTENRKKIIFKRSLIPSKQEESKEQTTPIQTVNADNVSSSDRSPSDYDNTPATVDEYDNLTTAKEPVRSVQKPHQLMEDYDYGVGEDSDDHIEDDVGQDNCSEGDDYEDNQHRNEDVEGYYQGDSDEECKRSIGGDQFADLDGDSRYSSSEYSD